MPGASGVGRAAGPWGGEKHRPRGAGGAGWRRGDRVWVVRGTVLEVSTQGRGERGGVGGGARNDRVPRRGGAREAIREWRLEPVGGGGLWSCAGGVVGGGGGGGGGGVGGGGSEDRVDGGRGGLNIIEGRRPRPMLANPSARPEAVLRSQHDTSRLRGGWKRVAVGTAAMGHERLIPGGRLLGGPIPGARVSCAGCWLATRGAPAGTVGRPR